MSKENEILQSQENVNDMNEVYLIEGEAQDGGDVYIDLDDSDDVLPEDAEVYFIEGTDDSEETIYIDLDDSADAEADFEDVYLISSEGDGEDGDVLLIDAQNPDDIQETVAVSLSSDDYDWLETIEDELENDDDLVDDDDLDDEDFIDEEDDDDINDYDDFADDVDVY